jgi:hypothetical protein
MHALNMVEVHHVCGHKLILNPTQRCRLFQTRQSGQNDISKLKLSPGLIVFHVNIN